MWWKCQYDQSSSDHGTLAYFRNRLNRIAVTKEPKKDVDACIDLIYTVAKGHFLACACDILGVASLDQPIDLPAGILNGSRAEQLAYISNIAEQVVDRCSLVDAAFIGKTSEDSLSSPPSLCGSDSSSSAGLRYSASTDSPTSTARQSNSDGVYNYARVLCHYASLIMEYRDAWAEGDGERVIRCWKLFLPHFKASGRTKYSLEALRLQMQANITLSPNLAHQVIWNRFVNVKGGAGKNIPCDLFNEHVNKQLKIIICNMGSNLTETALQRAARSVTCLHNLCTNFDKQSGVPYRTSAHSTKSDLPDVKKVVNVVLNRKLLTNISSRGHRKFPNMLSTNGMFRGH